MRSGDFDSGLKKFEDFVNSGRAPYAELYVVGIPTWLSGGFVYLLLMIDWPTFFSRLKRQSFLIDNRICGQV